MNSIILPDSFPLQREFRNPLSEEKYALYKDGKLGAYDYKTVFYDVFIDQESQEVIAIGPPPLNLLTELFPVKIEIDNTLYAMHVLSMYKKVMVLSAKIDFRNNSSEPRAAKMILANGHAHDLLLKKQPRLEGSALVTVQKNNKIGWIKDWIDYYREEFDVNHFYIYDNNSDNQKELIDSLSGKAQIVRWNFPFGVSDRSTNKFCQVGALNHFKWGAGRNCKTIFNFDIDEILICKNKKIKSRIQRSQLMRFAGYRVPHINFDNDEYSYDSYCIRDSKQQKEGYKYIVPGQLKSIMDVHHIVPELTWWRKLLPESLGYGKLVSTDDAYFLHYNGITNNWKNNNRLQLSDPLPAGKTEDYAANVIFSRIKNKSPELDRGAASETGYRSA